jgi:hypothetical protein
MKRKESKFVENVESDNGLEYLHHVELVCFADVSEEFSASIIRNEFNMLR